VCRRVDQLARTLHTSKKAVIERAVLLLDSTVERGPAGDVFGSTCGAWKRRETAAQTVSAARTAFTRAMKRHSR